MKHLLIIFVTVLVAAFSLQAKKIFDHSDFENMLRNNVDSKGMIEYTAFDNEEFDNYLERIAEADVNLFGKTEKLAFYINAHNAYVIKNILKFWPITNIEKDTKGFYTNYKFEVAGEMLSLDEIRKGKVLKMAPVFGHAALVRGTMSCPRMRNEAYSTQNVYKLMNLNLKSYINDASRNYLDKKEKVFYLSPLFKEYKKDFEGRFGSLMEMILSYMPRSSKVFIDRNGIEIKFLERDWRINAQKREIRSAK